MKNRLLIHDLQPGFAADGNYDQVVEDDGTIRNCIGCFTCWTKTPMECVLKDGYEHMADKLATCDELILVSKCTYGGPSAFVKNVLDRSIPYLHPNFVIKNGQMHHKQRFPQHFSIKVLFYGEDLTEAEKETSKEWGRAIAVNLNAVTVETVFYKDVAEVTQALLGEKKQRTDVDCERGEQGSRDCPAIKKETGIELISGSPKKKYSASENMLEELEAFLPENQIVAKLRCNETSFDENTLQILAEAKTLVFSFPLYVDSIPSHFLRCLKDAENLFAGRVLHKSVYVIVNCGFYEGEQTETALKMVESWCLRCGFTYGGGLGVGAGGMWHSIKDVQVGHGPKKSYGKHLRELAEKIVRQEECGNIFTTVNFPRFAYKMAGESSWKKAAKKNGVKL